MPGGAKEVEELSDKQLENLSKYGKNMKTVKKNGAKLTVVSSILGGGIGALGSGFSGKAAAKGAVIGAGVGSGLAVAGHFRNKKLAREAKEELDRRRKQKSFAKTDREPAPPEIVQRVKNGEGVIYKINGKWRIVSMKTNPPSLWPQSYDSEEKAKAALRGYQANKH